MKRTRVSENFYLDEFERSQVAARAGLSCEIDRDDPVLMGNIERLVLDVLQPLRSLCGRPIHITSGYRPVEVNKLVGGSPKSAHIRGLAADFHIVGVTPRSSCIAIKDFGLPTDKCILEFGQWVHAQVAEEGEKPRRLEFTAKVSNGKTRYLPGFRVM